MLSFVLPLLGMAIALTPIVASARVLYKRELDDQSFCSGQIEDLTTQPAAYSQAIFVKTLT